MSSGSKERTVLKFFAQRAVRFIAVLFAISVVSFVFLGAIPGNPVQVLLGQHASRADIERVTQELQLDKPWYVRLGAYLVQIGHGNLGTSLADRQPVALKLAEYFPATVELAFAAMIVAIVIGVPAGIVAALNHRRPLDALVTSGALLGVSIPVFWLGWMLLFLLAYEPTKIGLNLFPAGGRLDIRYDFPAHTHFMTIDSLLAGDWPAFGDALSHLVLPAITLATIPLAIVAKMTRAGMLEVLRTDYVRTAKAKGLGAWAVVVKHGLRNALVPIVTVIGLQTGLLLGGAVLTESIFSWPGVGRLAFEAISNRDYPLINGAVLLFATTFVVVNLVVDLLYAALDPRIRYA